MMASDRGEHGDDARAPQLARHRRPDDLDAPLRVVGAQRVDDLLHRHLLLGVTARLLLDADQHVGVGAEALDLHVADAELIQLLAHAGEIGRAALVTAPRSASRP